VRHMSIHICIMTSWGDGVGGAVAIGGWGSFMHASFQHVSIGHVTLKLVGPNEEEFLWRAADTKTLLN
jgi:hypothetical protein